MRLELHTDPMDTYMRFGGRYMQTRIHFVSTIFYYDIGQMKLTMKVEVVDRHRGG